MTKPGRFGEGNGKYKGWGQGSQVQQFPQKSVVTFKDFSGGYKSALGEEEGGEDSSPNCQDIYVNRANRLIRLPGGGGSTFVKGDEMLVHQSLQNIGELLFFQPPYFTIVSSVGTQAADLGYSQSDELYRWALFGETLVFTNGRDGVYTREPSMFPVLTNSIPMAKSYGVLASRLFAGGTIIDGEYQPMGIAWPNSQDFTDFVGNDAGFELLISDATKGDAIVAVRMMNLDLMGILCKQSIWIGRRTQDPFRPAAFEPRIMGDGGIHDRLCIVTPVGMTYLAETGVRTFDGNNTILLSAAINNELLPLDFDQINDYRLNYDYKRNWLYLHTPVCTWIYDIEYQRWYKMAVPGLLDMVIWKEQLGGTSWDEIESLGRTWDEMGGTGWSDLGRRESGWGAALFLQKDSTHGNFYWTEDPDSLLWPTYQPAVFNPQFPRWEFRHHEGNFDNTLITFDAINIHYKGGGDVRVFLADNEGTPQKVFRQTLPPPVGDGLRTVQINMIWSGKGVAAMIELVSGDLQIAKFQMRVQARSTDPSRPGSDLQEYFGFWDKP